MQYYCVNKDPRKVSPSLGKHFVYIKDQILNQRINSDLSGTPGMI